MAEVSPPAVRRPSVRSARKSRRTGPGTSDMVHPIWYMVSQRPTAAIAVENNNRLLQLQGGPMGGPMGGPGPSGSRAAGRSPTAPRWPARRCRRRRSTAPRRPGFLRQGSCAAGESSVILLPPPVPLQQASQQRWRGGCQCNGRTPAGGWVRPPIGRTGTPPVGQW